MPRQLVPINAAPRCKYLENKRKMKVNLSTVHLTSIDYINTIRYTRPTGPVRPGHWTTLGHKVVCLRTNLFITIEVVKVNIFSHARSHQVLAETSPSLQISIPCHRSVAQSNFKVAHPNHYCPISPQLQVACRSMSRKEGKCLHH